MATDTARKYRKAKREVNRFLKDNRKTKRHDGRVATVNFWRDITTTLRHKLSRGTNDDHN